MAESRMPGSLTPAPVAAGAGGWLDAASDVGGAGVFAVLVADLGLGAAVSAWSCARAWRVDALGALT
jgi:hypothetical protein